MLYINADDNPVTFNKKNYLMRAAERLGVEVRDAKGVSNPECVLNVQPFDFLPGTHWTGLWHIDVCLNSDIPSVYYYLCNDVFVASDQMRTKYDKAKLLFQACDPVLHKRVGEPEYDYVVCGLMGGAYNGERERLHRILAEKFKGFDGANGKRPEEYVKALSKGRVQWVRTANTEGNYEMAAQRFFESLAIGPVLTNWTKDLTLTGLVENEDYMAYRSERDMIKKMKLLLSNEGLRNRIATNGRNKALLYHTYEHRLMSILNVCREYDESIDKSALR